MFVNNFIINQSKSPAIYADVLANRPPAGVAGRLFIATDTLNIYRDTGSLWALLSGAVINGGLNYLAVFNSTNTISRSRIYDDGVTFLINSTSSFHPGSAIEAWGSGYETGFGAVNNSPYLTDLEVSFTSSGKDSAGLIKKISEISSRFYDASTSSNKGKLLLKVAGFLTGVEIQRPFLVGYFSGGARFFSTTETATEPPPGDGILHVNGKITIGTAGTSSRDLTIDNSSNAYLRLNRLNNLTTVCQVEFSEAGSPIWAIGQLNSDSTFSIYSFPLGFNAVNINHVTGYASFYSKVKSAGIVLNPVGSGISIKEGTNATMGAVSLINGTATVSTTKVSSSSRIFLTIQQPGGTVGTPYISAMTAGSSFTITSTSSTDTSLVAWLIIEPDTSV